jgi:mono/diheme cytochrome c family protein
MRWGRVIAHSLRLGSLQPRMGHSMANGTDNTEKSRFLSSAAIAAVCLVFAAHSQSSAAATATNLVTICTSAHATTQASKCTAWQYNVYSPTAYIESYPQVSPGPKVWTDPAYEYRLGSTITPTMGVKVCPTPLTSGTSFSSAAADPCPNNVLVSASTVIATASMPTATPTFSPTPGVYGPQVITNVSLVGPQSVTLSDSTLGASIHYTIDGSQPTLASPTYSQPILLPAGTGAGKVTTIHAAAFASGQTPSAVATGKYTVATLPSDHFAQPADNLLTVCTSAMSTTQASKCTGWQYNFFSPAAYLESYPQLSPGPKGFTDPAYEYRLGSTITPTTGVKVCPTALLPGTSFSSTSADACPANTLIAASTVIPTPPSPGYPLFLYGNYGIEDSCAYYRAIGAETTLASSGPCQLNPDGSFANGITIYDWKDLFYSPQADSANAVEGTALFVNINDLNFVRDHHATINASGTAGAAYVCNYPGPDFYHTGPTGTIDQAAVDAAIGNASDGLNPLPCVAFDYNIFSPAKGSTKYYDIRFLVFNQAGNLASAVDLDGRGPKQIPQACSACHGVPFGAGAPDSDQPNGAAYIPFDEGNMLFSSADLSSSSVTGLSPDVEAQIKTLNQIVLTGTTTIAAETDSTALSTQLISTLIHEWYDTTSGPMSSSIQLKSNAVPPGLRLGQPKVTQDLNDAYTKIYTPYCRSCHLANNVRTPLNFGPPPTNPNSLLNDFADTGNLEAEQNQTNICNPSSTGGPRTEIMPNSKVAFDRLWSTHVVGPYNDPSNSKTDLIDLLQRLGIACTPSLN